MSDLMQDIYFARTSLDIAERLIRAGMEGKVRSHVNQAVRQLGGRCPEDDPAAEIRDRVFPEAEPAGK